MSESPISLHTRLLVARGLLCDVAPTPVSLRRKLRAIIALRDIPHCSRSVEDRNQRKAAMDEVLDELERDRKIVLGIDGRYRVTELGIRELNLDDTDSDSDSD